MAEVITGYFLDDYMYVNSPNGPVMWRNPFWNIIELTFEKVYTNLIMIMAKNYAGFKHVVTEASGEFNARGLAQLKRRLPPLIKEILKNVSSYLCVDGDVEKALSYAKLKLNELWKKKGTIPELTLIQRLSKPLEKYGTDKIHKDKKTGEDKIRKGAEGCVVKVAKDNWNMQLEMARKVEKDNWNVQMKVAEKDAIERWYRMAEKSGKVVGDGECVELDMAVKVAKEKCRERLEMEKLANSREVIVPAGAGETIQYVYVIRHGVNPRKAKKAEKAMNPFTAISTKAELDYEEYAHILETQLCTLLRHPIDLIHPGEIYVHIPKVYLEKTSNRKMDDYLSKDSKQPQVVIHENEDNSANDDDDDEEEQEDVDEIDIDELTELTPKQVEAKKKYEKELQKQLDKKVLRYLYEGQKRPAIISGRKQTNNTMANFLVPPKYCSICERQVLDSHTTSKLNSSICKKCIETDTSVNTVRKHCSSHSNLKKQLAESIVKQKTVRSTCEKCMDTTYEETLNCISLSCQYMVIRQNVDESVDNLKNRINKIDLSW